MLKKRNGFSVIELLTVIAIIGVLAAFLFPVVASSKANAKKTQCISNMHQIWTAMKAFQQNEGRYPDFIAGPCPDGGSGAISIKDTPGVVEGRATSLYPEYIKSEQILYCPMAVRNGAGREFTYMDTIDDPMHGFPNLSSGYRWEGLGGKPFKIYPYSTYDVQIPRNRKPAGGSPIPWEVHYSPMWLDSEKSPPDKPWLDTNPWYVRQLRWKVPPEDTVVTWCSYHREGRGPNVDAGSMDLVLFLDGHVKPLSSARLYDNDYATVDWTVVWKNAVP